MPLLDWACRSRAGQHGIELERGDQRTGTRESARQDTRSRPDLDDTIAATHIGVAHERGGQPATAKKMLARRTRWGTPNGHGRIPSSCRPAV